MLASLPVVADFKMAASKKNSKSSKTSRKTTNVEIAQKKLNAQKETGRKLKSKASSILMKYKVTSAAELKGFGDEVYNKYKNYQNQIKNSQSKEDKYDAELEQAKSNVTEMVIEEDNSSVMIDDPVEGAQGAQEKKEDDDEEEMIVGDDNNEDEDDENEGNERDNSEDEADSRESGEIQPPKKKKWATTASISTKLFKKPNAQDAPSSSRLNERIEEEPSTSKLNERINNSVNTTSSSLIDHWEAQFNIGDSEEGYYKYTSRIQFFKNELKECHGKVTLSFTNMDIQIKKSKKFYASPLEANSKGVDPKEIINAFFGFLNVEVMYAALEKAKATPQVLRFDFAVYSWIELSYIIRNLNSFLFIILEIPSSPIRQIQPLLQKQSHLIR